jgi:serine/threonine protein kinase
MGFEITWPRTHAPRSDPQHRLRQRLVKKLGQEGLAFIHKCLAFTPEKRHSAALALEHDFLANV